MIIRCPNCGSTYDISKQPQAVGRKVKCMRCSTVWKAEPVEGAPPPAPQAHKAAEAPPPVPPQPAASEIAFDRTPQAPARAEPAPPPAPVAEQRSLFANEPEPAIHASNSFSGGAEPATNGYHAAEHYVPPPAPLAPPPRRSDFDADPAPARRQPPPREREAEYTDDEPVASRPPARPARPARRQPPEPTYRDDVHGDFGPSAYEQDDFRPSRDARLDRDSRGPTRGRRAALIVGWVAYLATIASIGAYAYAGRDQIVAWLPGAAPYYADLGLPVNRFGLEFRDVTAKWSSTPSGRRALEIAVGVENVSPTAVRVPSVVIAFKDANGDELFYHAEADALPKTLQAGKKAKFAATVPVPADATRAVQVRFATGR